MAAEIPYPTSLCVKIVRLEERMAAIDKALVLQAAEYSRRLDGLNHAHEEARAVLNTYMTRETWDNNLKEHDLWREKVDASLARQPEPNAIDGRLKVLETSYARSEGAISQAKTDASALAFKVSAGMGVITLVVTIALKFVH